MTTNTDLERVSRTATPKRFSVADFRKMTEIGILPEESGWEIIDGYLIDKMPIGTKHASVVRKLEKFFERNFGDKAIISGQNPIHLDEYNEPEPDVALLKLRADFYAESHPTPADVLLLVEVSDSTLEYDRETKKNLYAEAGIAEFWLVNLKNDTIEVYAHPKNGNYYSARILEPGETIESAAVEDLTLALNEILGL